MFRSILIYCGHSIDMPRYCKAALVSQACCSNLEYCPRVLAYLQNKMPSFHGVHRVHFVFFFSSTPSMSLVFKMNTLPLAADQTDLKGSSREVIPIHMKDPCQEGLPGTTFHKSHSPMKTTFPNTGLYLMFFQQYLKPCKSYEGFSMG